MAPFSTPSYTGPHDTCDASGELHGNGRVTCIALTEPRPDHRAADARSLTETVSARLVSTAAQLHAALVSATRDASLAGRREGVVFCARHTCKDRRSDADRRASTRFVYCTCTLPARIYISGCVSRCGSLRPRLGPPCIGILRYPIASSSCLKISLPTRNYSSNRTRLARWGSGALGSSGLPTK